MEEEVTIQHLWCFWCHFDHTAVCSASLGGPPAPSSWLFIPTRLCVLAGAYVQSCDPADHKAALEQVLLPGAGATAHTQIALCQSSDHRLPLCTHNRVYRNFPLAAKLAMASHLFKDRPPIPNSGAATADFVRPRIQKTRPASSNCTS